VPRRRITRPLSLHSRSATSSRRTTAPAKATLWQGFWYLDRTAIKWRCKPVGDFGEAEATSSPRSLRLSPVGGRAAHGQEQGAEQQGISHRNEHSVT